MTPEEYFAEYKAKQEAAKKAREEEERKRKETEEKQKTETPDPSTANDDPKSEKHEPVKGTNVSDGPWTSSNNSHLDLDENSQDVTLETMENKPPPPEPKASFLLENVFM